MGAVELNMTFNEFAAFQLGRSEGSHLLSIKKSLLKSQVKTEAALVVDTRLPTKRNRMITFFNSSSHSSSATFPKLLRVSWYPTHVDTKGQLT